MTFFTASDFDNDELTLIRAKDAAYKANVKLLREAKVVYLSKADAGIDKWLYYEPVSCDKKALLVCIEEIEKKPCEHPRKWLQTHGDFHNAKCGQCGVKLKAKWEVVE